MDASQTALPFSISKNEISKSDNMECPVYLTYEELKKYYFPNKKQMPD